MKIKFTLKYFAFASAILILTSFCDVMFNDKVHYNTCFEERGSHVFILPTGPDILSHIG